ncbi:MAG: hypothetical protein KIT02_00140 [Devosia sp.]|uniref:hypothetical protein n=1 Tax=Devosia sp. TaxID=1871048 RepID=UPI0024C77AEE|nr:hypothetical protein [Devosia sp.]UYN99694.1 MAG: hypothetical protein KIT02_00140 [Devosia sp.]
MLRIANISATVRAAELLDQQRVIFRPRDPGDAFALTFISSFVDERGSIVAGFVPGYTADSVSPMNLSDMWALGQPSGAPEFLFMPKFRWRADERYLIDVASEAFDLFSIGPKGP